LKIRQGSSEASSSSKGPVITIDHLTSTLSSTPEVSQASTTEGTYDKKPSLFSQYLDIKRKIQGVKNEMYPWAWGKNTTQTKLLYVVDYQ
jgi:hypothetical protein